MKQEKRLHSFVQAGMAALLTLTVFIAGCGQKKTNAVGHGEPASKKVEIRIKGSDTMSFLAMAWAEAYRKVKPDIVVNATGGGTGTGIAALENNDTDICTASREMRSEERDRVKAATGKEIKEFVIAYDALAVYTHPSNPVKEISIEELREIWAEGGAITNWEQLEPPLPGKIVLFGRMNNSGTYGYFRDHICGNTAAAKQREFRRGIVELNNPAEVVANVVRTPTAMGYGGMDSGTSDVNRMKISGKKGEPGVEPDIDALRSGNYPLSRKLFLYTAGDPHGEIKEFIDWLLSYNGQAIVTHKGFLPLQ